MNGKNNRNLTIFGGTGDLSYRKLMPALYNLYVTKKIDSSDMIIVIGRRNYTTLNYIDIIKPWVSKFSRVEFSEEKFNEFIKLIHYFKMNFTEIDEYKKLSSFLCEKNFRENIFYYAVAPEFFDVISKGLNVLVCKQKSKVIIEKPFGKTLEEANKLSHELEDCFGIENVYRIDHYLGKEMIRSISTIRFENAIFKNCWDKNSIEHIQIMANEEVGVETRGNYYDKSGALKDMVQNHLMQILSLIAMEEPPSEKDIKTNQNKVLKSLRPVDNVDINETLILGQYKGYNKEENVSPNTTTETLAFCKFFIDNDRWNGVPFYIVTGKKMATREMNIVITFKNVGKENNSNILVFQIQPSEGVSIRFNMKKPGESEEIIQGEMNFSQSYSIGAKINTPEAYERLLNAAMVSDRTWFSSWEQIYLSWKYIENLKELHKKNNLPIHIYDVGSKGPDIINEMASKYNYKFDYTQYYCNI